MNNVKLGNDNGDNDDKNGHDNNDDDGPDNNRVNQNNEQEIDDLEKGSSVENDVENSMRVLGRLPASFAVMLPLYGRVNIGGSIFLISLCNVS